MASYVYKGVSEEEKLAAVPTKLSEEKIKWVLDKVFAQSLENATEVHKFSINEIKSDTERQFRLAKFPKNVDLNVIVEKVKNALKDSIILLNTRVGNKAASSLAADFIQKTISEKRGGSGKESGLTMLSILDELTSVTKKRRRRIVWAYPASQLDKQQKEDIKIDLVNITLSDIIVKTQTFKYDDDVPEWYKYIGEVPPEGYHLSIYLDLGKMVKHAILMSAIARVIKGLIPKPEAIRLFTSPYQFGIIDVFFLNSLDDFRKASGLGVTYVTLNKASAQVKGIPGISDVIESNVNLSTVLRETIMMSNGKWVTYYSLPEMLRYNMGIKHLKLWMEKAVGKEIIWNDNNSFFTDYDPRERIKSFSETDEANETRFEILYSGETLSDFFLDRRFDTSRMMTNDYWTLYDILGIGSARTYINLELTDLLTEIVKAFDGRHIEILVDLICVTGTLTAMSYGGMAERGDDPLSRMTLRQPEAIATNAAAFGIPSKLNTITNKRLVGTGFTGVGSQVWVSEENPTVGPYSSMMTEDDIKKLRGKRIPSILEEEMPPQEKKEEIPSAVVPKKRTRVPISGRKKIQVRMKTEE